MKPALKAWKTAAKGKKRSIPRAKLSGKPFPDSLFPVLLFLIDFQALSSRKFLLFPVTFLPIYRTTYSKVLH